MTPPVEEVIEPGDGLARVRAAIAGLVSAFATDGYELKIVGVANGCLRLAIEAHEGACAECLVPPEMMVGLVRTQLPPEFSGTQIQIAYPSATH
jgi:hypothetical protein